MLSESVSDDEEPNSSCFIKSRFINPSYPFVDSGKSISLLSKCGSPSVGWLRFGLHSPWNATVKFSLCKHEKRCIWHRLANVCPDEEQTGSCWCLEQLLEGHTHRPALQWAPCLHLIRSQASVKQQKYTLCIRYVNETNSNIDFNSTDNL